MVHWFDRLAIAITEAEDRTLSRRDALRGGGRLAGVALVGSTVAGVVAPAASAAANDYCLPACLAMIDNAFNHFTATCEAEYAASHKSASDASLVSACLFEAQLGLEYARANCGKPFCGNKKRFPPHRGPSPVPKHVPPTKPPPRPPPGGHGSGGPCGSRFGCGPVCCDPNELCCTKDNFGQVLQFCVPKDAPGSCHGALTGPM